MDSGAASAGAASWASNWEPNANPNVANKANIQVDFMSLILLKKGKTNNTLLENKGD